VAHDETTQLRLVREAEPGRDHVRGTPRTDAVTVIGYQDFLCPYCRRARTIFRQVRADMGDRLRYVYRHFPNEAARPGAELVARAAEAAALQDRFWEMHDGIFDHELPIGRDEIMAIAQAIGLDMERFAADLAGTATRDHVAEDLDMGRENGVTGTPTLFVDGVRYDGAWDYHSMREAFEQPFATRLHRSARVFASLPTSAGLVLLLAALLAIICANTPLATLYDRMMTAEIVIGAGGRMLALSIREWLADGLLSFFFLIVALEIRRELTAGALSDRRAALLPIIAAVGGVVMPALVYLAFNPGPTTSGGWPIPTATDIAFALALLAVLGDRVPIGLRAFVAALAVIDDILTIGTLAFVFPGAFTLAFLVPALGCVLSLIALNRARVYATWPYVFAAIGLWLSLHALGVDGALTGVLLAFCLPTRPAPSPASLLAQATTALSELDHAEREARRAGRESHLEREPIWEWAARNLWATSERLLSPAERIERAVAPWSAFFVLPLFAFSATGIGFAIHLSSSDEQRVLAGTIAGLVIGKPLGIVLTSAIAVRSGVAARPADVSLRQFVGAACLCGVGDMLALLMADRAFSADIAAVAKLGVLAGSIIAAVIGLIILRGSRAGAVAGQGGVSEARVEDS
jgi:NhaA family Na+:H+ antiporter